jgi:hypothetical protein
VDETRTLETQFREHLANECDSVGFADRMINFVLHRDSYTCCDYEKDHQIPPISDRNFPLARLTAEQHAFASQSIDTVIHVIQHCKKEKYYEQLDLVPIKQSRGFGINIPRETTSF